MSCIKAESIGAPAPWARIRGAGSRAIDPLAASHNGVIFTAKELKALPVGNDVAHIWIG